MIENYISSHQGLGQDQDVPSVLEPWDWRYYAEKIRQSEFNIDSSELKPYFSLSNMCAALFDCAERLFSLRFVPIQNFPSYHPDVMAYEVREKDSDGNEVLRAIFLHDNFSRPNKQGGAWMSSYRVQTRNFSPDEALSSSPQTPSVRDGSVIPVIVNNNNFAKAPEGSETLLSFTDAVTLFHEFGHGLHGMLSNVTYKTLSGTSVLRDFVELPSQLFEHWVSEPEVLKKYALHYMTKEPIPDDLLRRLKASQSFNSGFNTVEYLSSALVDQALHKLPSIPDGFDINAFETEKLSELEMPYGMVLRHRPTHFLHLFSSSSYAAAYYVYLWAEVLDADGFEAFKETGDVFNPLVSARLRQFIYSAGNSIEPGEAYRLFRGRDPAVEPMLKKKSLLDE